MELEEDEEEPDICTAAARGDGPMCAGDVSGVCGSTRGLGCDPTGGCADATDAPPLTPDPPRGDSGDSGVTVPLFTVAEAVTPAAPPGMYSYTAVGRDVPSVAAGGAAPLAVEAEAAGTLPSLGTRMMAIGATGVPAAEAEAEAAVEGVAKAFEELVLVSRIELPVLFGVNVNLGGCGAAGSGAMRDTRPVVCTIRF